MDKPSASPRRCASRKRTPISFSRCSIRLSRRCNFRCRRLERVRRSEPTRLGWSFMKVEIFTLCDAATADSGGKLNILGSFDRINANAVPVTHPLCALAIKMRFERLEEGEKRIGISFVDSDGTAVMSTLEAGSQ